MTKSNLNRRLALLNLIVLIILSFDTYILKPIGKKEIFDIYSSVQTLDVETFGPSHITNFILTRSGHKYREPNNSKCTLEYGDTFYIEKSVLFHKPIHIIYKTPTGFYKLNNGGLNEGYFGLIIFSYILTVSLLNIFSDTVIKRQNLNEKLIFSGTSLLCVLIFFYFFS